MGALGAQRARSPHAALASTAAPASAPAPALAPPPIPRARYSSPLNGPIPRHGTWEDRGQRPRGQISPQSGETARRRSASPTGRTPASTLHQSPSSGSPRMVLQDL